MMVRDSIIRLKTSRLDFLVDTKMDIYSITTSPVTT